MGIGAVLLIIGGGIFMTTYLRGATGYHSKWITIGISESDSPLSDLHQTTTNYSFSDEEIAGLQAVYILSDCAEITVSTGSGNGQVQFSGLEDADYYFENGELHINASGNWTTTSGRIDLLLPEEVSLSQIIVETDVGSIHCSRLSGLGFGRFTTQVGDIELRELDAEQLELTDDCGDIDLETVECGSLTADNNLGDIDLDGDFGSLTLTLAMGDCEVDGRTGSFTIQNDMGNVEMELTDAADDYDLDITNDCGSIRVTDQVMDQKTSGGSLQCGSSKAPYTGTVTCGMGSVEIQFKN
jgi:hypothetical protein